VILRNRAKVSPSPRAGTMQLHSWGAQPPRLQFGAPRAEHLRRGKSPNGGLISRATVSREGALPFFNCIVPAGGEGWGENSPQPVAHIEPLNLEKPTTSVSFAPIGGEGWGEGALRVHGASVNLIEYLRIYAASPWKKQIA
jgi:hypothetical protein